MAETKTKDITITQLEDYNYVLQWGNLDQIAYRVISAIQQSAPVRLTVAGHGLVDGWPVAVTNVKGMTEINAEANNLSDSDFHPVTVVDASTVEINAINAAGFKAYVSGGILQYNTPFDLAGYSAEFVVRKSAGFSRILRCTAGGTSSALKPEEAGTDGTVTWVEAGIADDLSSAERAALTMWKPTTAYSIGDVVDIGWYWHMTSTNGGIVIDNATKTVTLVFTKLSVASATWKKGEYFLNMVSGSGKVKTILNGTLVLPKG